MPLPPEEATSPKSFSQAAGCWFPGIPEFLMLEPIEEGNGVGETSAIELLRAFPLLLRLLLIPFRDVLSQLLSQLTFVLELSPLAELIDVDMKSRRFSFPFFHQVLAANGMFPLFAWFDVSPVLILLFELLTTLLLSVLLLRGKDKGDIVRSDDLIRFLLLWLLLLRLLLMR